MEPVKIKLIAGQAHTMHRYNNLKAKLIKCSANIYFNKQCILRKVIPNYAKVKVSYTSPASAITQAKAQFVHLKEEVKLSRKTT
jgi:hypothetical protein